MSLVSINQASNESGGWTEKFTTQVLQRLVLVSGGWTCVDDSAETISA